MINVKPLPIRPSRAYSSSSQVVTVLFLICADTLALLAAAFVSSQLFGFPPAFDALSLLVPLALWLLVLWREEMYPGYGLTRPRKLEKITSSSLFIGLILFAVKPFIYPGMASGYMSIFLATLLGGLLIGFFRFASSKLLHRLGVWGEPLVIIGTDEAAARISQNLLRNPLTGLRPVAIFNADAKPLAIGHSVGGVKVLGNIEQASQYAREHNIQRVILTASSASPSSNLLEKLDTNTFKHVQILPEIPGLPVHTVSTKPLSDYLTLNITNNLKRRSNQMFKRTFDLVATVTGGLLISPLLLLLVVLIKLDSKGSVLYSQQRLGKNGKPFRIWKFRSMVQDADAALERHLAAHPELREEWERNHKLVNDPRITRIGKILRATSLDELPQLINVLRGEMSLVGPRPIVEAEIEKYNDAFDLYKLVRPGMTGYWQVSGRSNTSYAYRVSLDSFYTRNWSIWLDLTVLIATVGVVLKREGAY